MRPIGRSARRISIKAEEAQDGHSAPRVPEPTCRSGEGIFSVSALRPSVSMAGWNIAAPCVKGCFRAMLRPSRRTAACPLSALGADLLREMIGFAAERLMGPEVGAVTGAAYGEKLPARLARRNGDPDQADPRRATR